MLLYLSMKDFFVNELPKYISISISFSFDLIYFIFFVLLLTLVLSQSKVFLSGAYRDIFKFCCCFRFNLVDEEELTSLVVGKPWTSHERISFNLGSSWQLSKVVIPTFLVITSSYLISITNISTCNSAFFTKCAKNTES